jgi:hypothetical protein
MREGEVALWHGGTIVWTGSLGARIEERDFDAVTIHVNDARRLALMGEGLSTKDLLDALAGWWSL